MNKLFKIFLASVLALTMCVPIASLASGEVNLCGSYAQIAEGGSILSYTDGSFSGEGTFTNDSVSSGFCSVNVGSGEVTSTTGSVLTYPTGVGGRAADDRSVKLTSTASAATALSVGELSGSALNNSYFATSSLGKAFVIEFDFLAEESVERRVEFKFGNANQWKMTLKFLSDGNIERQYRKPNDTSAQTESIDATYELGKWNRVKIIRDLTDVEFTTGVNKNKDYIYLNGKKIVESDVFESSTALTYVTFSQQKGTGSMYIDDAEIYIAEDLAAALNEDNESKFAAEISSASANCVVNNMTDAITYTSSTATVTLEDLKSAVTGNISGIYRDGALLISGNLADGDTIIVRSEDGRTFRYYTLGLTINLTNIASSATIVSGVTQKSDSTVTWTEENIKKMFDNDKTTCLKAGTANLSGEFIIDLTTVNEFNQVSIYKPNETPRAFKLTVQVSDDNKNWADVMTGANVPDEREEELIYDIPKASGRYVKFYIHDITPSGKYYGFAISELGLYYDAGLPKMTSYRCLLSKNTEDATKLNARVEASAAVGAGFGGILLGAVYDKDWKMLKATVLEDAFAVAADTEYSHVYSMDYVTGTKYAKVFLWNSMSELVPLYNCSDYAE